jgi:hypothetical protein
MSSTVNRRGRESIPTISATTDAMATKAATVIPTVQRLAEVEFTEVAIFIPAFVPFSLRKVCLAKYTISPTVLVERHSPPHYFCIRPAYASPSHRGGGVGGGASSGLSVHQRSHNCEQLYHISS